MSGPQVFTGTLLGPEGTTVGRWVKFEEVHNLLEELAELQRKHKAMAIAQCQAEANLRAENVKLRDKLLELAKDCSECGGTGCVTVTEWQVPAFGKVLPCPDCEDIRELLK